MSLEFPIRLIGDVHGKFREYKAIVDASEQPTVQLGDLGFKTEHNKILYSKSFDRKRNKVLFGNHDFYPFVMRPHSLGHFGMYNGMFFVRGAYSIDQSTRVWGKSWFHEEELTYAQAYEAIERYAKDRPDIVISHDCPSDIGRMIHSHHSYDKPSFTATFLQNMFEIHQPRLWVHGHHHKSYRIMANGTQFVCLAELETLVVD